MITLVNKTDRKLDITEFGIWIFYAYVMFRDKNVLRNIHNSAAVFPSLDGMLFHKLYLAGGYENGFKNHDWIYSKEGFEVEAHAKKTWQIFIKKGWNWGTCE